jgi:hypothetical protein
MSARAACLVLVAAVAAGCGGKEVAAAPAPPVRVDVTSPADNAVVRDAVVEVRGRVRPSGARVTVLGVPAAVVGGEFSARVPVAEGANVIDVAATAPGASPGFTSVRVQREVRVTVPDLIGRTAEEAFAELDHLGLEPQEERGGGLLEPLLPGKRKVCDTDPRGGNEVPRGTRVRVLVAKDC